MKRRTKVAVFGALRRHREWVAWSLVATTLLFAWAPVAEARLGATLPLVENNGAFSCPTCATESSPSQYGIPVWATTQEFGVIAPSSQTTYPLFSAGTGANPAFRAMVIGDLPSDTSANWAGRMSDETGTTGGFVRAGGPTIDSPVITTSIDLPSGAVNAIGEIDSTIKQGASGGTKLATTTGTAGSNGNLAVWDTNGNLVDGGAPGGSSGVSIDISPLTSWEVTAGTPLWCGNDGSCSTTTDGADVQTPVKSARTFTELDCQAVGATGQAFTVVKCVATVGGGTPDCTGKSQVVMSATAWTQGTISGTTTTTADDYIVNRITVASGTSNKVVVRCSEKQV